MMRMFSFTVVLYLKKNRMAQRHAPFDKKKPWRHVLPMCPFSFLQTIRNLSLEFSKNLKKMFVTIHSSSFAD
jgi:hypothetical protein